MMSETNRKEVDWQAQAAAWELMALAFRLPDKVLAKAVSSGEWRDAALELTDVLGVGLPEGWDEGLDAALSREADSLMHELRVEHTHLFLGAPDPVVSPYEGVWAAMDDGVQPLLFVNPKSMAVERFIKACGLGRPKDSNEPLDFVATECELLEYLALLAGGFAETPENSRTLESFPGGSASAAYTEFLTEHAMYWLPRFADAVIAKSRIPFYRSAAQMLKALVPQCAQTAYA